MFGLRTSSAGAYRMNNGLSKISVRYITIQQPSTVVTTQPVSLENTKNKDDASVLPIIDSEKADTIDTPWFKTIGTPASSLSVTVPPSIPIHVKKGSIISVYSFAQKNETSGDANFIKSKWELEQPLRRLWFSGKVSSYQSIISTVPLQVLVSAYDGYEGNTISGVKSFTNLTLDGTVDWALYKPNALQCYTGNALNVKIKSLPKDLHYGFSGRGYTWINGRGLVSIVGDGSVFKVGLGASEEIRVGRDNILAMSINDVADLSNGSVKSEIWNSVDGLFHKKTEIIKEEVHDVEETAKDLVLTKNKSVDHALTLAWEYSKSFVDVLKTGKSQLTDYVLGSGHYVVVKGPRTVLIETCSGKDKFVVRANDLFNNGGRGGVISQLESSIKNESEWNKPAPSVGDNLGVVKIVNGKATFKNLENFNEEVERIEGLKKGN